MIATFLATLDPLLSLFFFIAVGYAVHKAHLLPDNAGKVMSRLETYVFCPALNFITMARFCTVQTLGTYAVNIVLATVAVSIAIGLATLLAALIIRRPGPERGVYRYALAFANSGYMGDPLILSLFGSATLALYKIYTLPLNIGTYTWGLAQFLPSDHAEKGGVRATLKKLCNAPILSLLLGIVVGLSGLGAHLPAFAVSSLEALKSCLGPVAMLLVGFTVAGYHLPTLLKKREVYIATALRLLILPAVIVAAVFGCKQLGEVLLSTQIDNTVVFLCFFTVATPLGLNTVVFPEAYGGDPAPGASMSLISHVLCVVTIPLLFALMTLLFGTPNL